MSNSLWPYGLKPTNILCPWGFSRQEYWSGLPWGCHFLLPEDLPSPGIEPVSLMSPALAGGFFTMSATWEVQNIPGKERNRSLESATCRGCQYQIISLPVRANYFCPNSIFLHLLHPRSQRWPSWWLGEWQGEWGGGELPAWSTERGISWGERFLLKEVHSFHFYTWLLF